MPGFGAAVIVGAGAGAEAAVLAGGSALTDARAAAAEMKGMAVRVGWALPAADGSVIVGVGEIALEEAGSGVGLGDGEL